MTHPVRRWLLLSGWAVALPVHAGAGDCSFEPDVFSWAYPSSGLVFEPGNSLRIKEEHLTISGDIDVDYVLANDTDEDIVMPISFPIPDQHSSRWDTMMNAIDPHDEDFAVWVDGAPIKARKTVKVLRDNGREREPEDVTSHFRALGQDPEKTKFRSPEIRRKLLELGVACKCNDTDVDEEAFACWNLRTTYAFTQRFPAHGSVSIRHHFSPWAASEPANFPTIEQACQRLGGSREECEESLDLSRQGVETRISFDQVELSNLTGTIGKFTMTIDPAGKVPFYTEMPGLSLSEKDSLISGTAENFTLPAKIGVTFVEMP